MSKSVVCIGEVLWDSLPHGMYLGGAPLNVAVNLKNLGINSAMISAVGDDKLGKRTLTEIKARGLDTSTIQINPKETGLVEVSLNDKGVPTYIIHEHRAWDYIEATNDARSLVKKADYLVFGSLVLRNHESAAAVIELLNSSAATKILDVNFRKPFYNKALIEKLFGYADVLKVNDEEIEEIADWFGLEVDYKDAIPKLCAMFGIQKAIVTLGENGSSLFVDGAFVHHPRFEVVVKDTVGAGDAFLSGAIYSFIHEKSSIETLKFANAMGAFVAGSEGATPNISVDLVTEKFFK